MISELMQLDLPAPVAPATRMCGILARLAHDEAALDVLAERRHHRVVVALGDGRTQHVAQHHHLGVGVGDLDADRALAGDRAQDPHVGALHRVGDVAGQLGDPLDLDRRARARPRSG